ncbi:uncharacterized protein ACB058_020133 [Synchiropus picturatus]
MEEILSCVVCLWKCKHVGEMKQHMQSSEHTRKMSQVFQKVFFHFPGFFPDIKDCFVRQNFRSPLLGLSLLTLCFSPEIESVFYLCHACEEKVPPETVYSHMLSEDHVSNYYTFTDPNRLFFSWLTDVNVRMNNVLKQEAFQCSRSMQLLDLPKEMWAQFQNLTYFEVMTRITEKLPNHIKALSLPRVEIEAYLKDAKKRHPLLGIQHIVECTTIGETKKCYLCTLCKLSFPNQLIIKHVLSFDHVFAYLAAWHPSSLMPKEFYTPCKATYIKMLDLAKEDLDILGCGQMRQLRLESDDFQSVNFSSYEQALAKLESIAKEKHEPSLVVNIIPVNRLACVQSCELHCQNCNETLLNGHLYFEHVLSADHRKMRSLLLSKDSSLEYVLKLGKRINESTTTDTPAVGTTMVMFCVGCEESSNMLVVCFACELVMWSKLLFSHLRSREHLISTLMYFNPWRLPFAWHGTLNVPLLNNIALEEEQKRGPKRLMVLDIPRNRFPAFSKLGHTRMMKELSVCDPSFKCKVPLQETSSTLCEERYPLLGLQFIVKYYVSHFDKTARFACLLCKMKVENDAWHAHVISRVHVASFLKSFHPGSVDISTTEVELLDLARQSMAYHPIAEIQEVSLARPIWEVDTVDYNKLLRILKANKSCLNECLPSPIIPQVKLVPRTSGETENTNHAPESTTEKTDQSSPEKLDSERERITSVSTNKDFYQKESKSEPQSQDAVLLEKMGQENEALLQKEQPVGQQNRGEKMEQKQADFLKQLISESSSQKNMSNERHCPEEFDGKIQQVVGLPFMNSAERHPKTNHLNRIGHEVPLDKDAEAAGRCDVCPTEPTRGVEPSHLQKAMYWTDTPASQYRSPQVLSSPSAASTLNPNAAFMSDTNHSNVEGTRAQGSANPQITLPRTIRTTERSLSNDHSRPAGKRSNKEKRPPKVGLSYIITVVCGEKQQVYCQLCSIRLNQSTHLSSLEHQRKYVKKRFPHWNATSADENELAKMVNKLFDMDKGLSDQKLKVELEMYQNLAILPEVKAILALRQILSTRGKRNSISVAPCSDEVSSPRIPSTKDGGQHIPGRMQRQSSSTQSLKEGGQKCVEGPENWKPVKAIEKSSADRTVERCRENPYDASEKHTQSLIKESLNPKEASMCRPGFHTVHQSLLKDHQKPNEASEKSPVGLEIKNSLLKDTQKLYEAPKKSRGLSSVTCAPHEERSSLGISSSNQNLLEDMQRAASGSSSADQNSRMDGQKPYEAAEKSLPRSSAISKKPYGGPEKYLPSCSSANQSSIKDHQKPQKADEKSSVGFSRNCQSLLQNSLKPHESPDNASPGFTSIDIKSHKELSRSSQSLLQSNPKPHDASSANRPHEASKSNCADKTFMKDNQKPHEASGKSSTGFPPAIESLVKAVQNQGEALGKSPGGFPSAYQTLVQNTERLPERSLPGFYTIHWKLHEAHHIPLICTANQSLMKNGQKPLEAPEISPTGFSNGDNPGEHFPLLQPGQSEQQMPIEPGMPGSGGTIDVGPRDLYSLLKKNDVQDIIGLALIWECHATPDSAGSPTLYLCESCSKTMLFDSLCQHLVSVEHLHNYLLREYPHLIDFWFMEDLLPWMKEEILREVAHFLAVRERHTQDAQVLVNHKASLNT